MSFFRGLFRPTPPPVEQVHPLFGRITYAPDRSRQSVWRNERFELWGYSAVVLMLEADASGPTPAQEEAFRRFHDARDRLLPMCLAAVAAERARTDEPDGPVAATALSIPSLAGDAVSDRLWTLWFDYEGEEHWSYGVQTTDRWATVSGFAED